MIGGLGLQNTGCVGLIVAVCRRRQDSKVRNRLYNTIAYVHLQQLKEDRINTVDMFYIGYLDLSGCVQEGAETSLHHGPRPADGF